MGSLNDGLRFVIEIAALLAVGYWGLATRAGVLRWVAGICAPVAIAVVWVAFVNPDGAARASDPVRLLLEVAIFGGGVAALLDADRRGLALALAIAAGIHVILTFPLHQR